MHNVQRVNFRVPLTLRRPAVATVRHPAPRLVLMTALIGISTTGFVLRVGSISLSLERGVGLSLLVWMSALFIVDKEQSSAKNLVNLWLLWIVSQIVSLSLTRDPVGHLPGLIMALVPIAYFYFMIKSRLETYYINRFFRITLWLNAALGTFAVALKIAAGYSIPLFFDYIQRLKLGFLEPNLLGSSIGFFVLITLPRAKLNWQNCLLYTLTAIVFASCFSKGPFIAAVICLVAYTGFRAVALRRAVIVPLLLASWLGIVGTIIALLFAPTLQGAYEESLARNDAVQVRAFVVRVAMNKFEQKPIMGNGPGDFSFERTNLLEQFGTEVTRPWIPQMMINIMHDSGVVGLAVYLLFLGLLILRGYAYIKAGSVDHSGYLAGFLFILLCSQASSVHLNAIFGIASGLVAVSPYIRRDLPPGSPSIITRVQRLNTMARTPAQARRA